MNNQTMRDAFFDRLYEIAKKDKDVLLVSADMAAPSLDQFRAELSSQFIDVGIAEQSLVTIGSGLALGGKKVFIYAIMPFVTLRCYEQLKIELSLMKIPVTAVGVGSGLSYDDSGPTHHSTEDIAIMRALPNMVVLNASDSVMAAKFAEMSCESPEPGYVRLDREVLPAIYKEGSDFADGLACLKEGKDVCIIATGNMVHSAFEVATKLEKHSISAGIVDLYRIKPVNQKLLLEMIKGVPKLVTLEENLINGGLGSIVAEVLADNGVMLPLKRFAIPDKYYYAYGGRKNIQTLCGLDVPSITKGILEWLNKD
ncbi:MAG: transketolase C-terminal domain-containing protein [Dehalococcoidales bacterium]|nr:transketolase C-terminal domain-containing protein [Dehalococcoidales bacterium]